MTNPHRRQWIAYFMEEKFEKLVKLVRIGSKLDRNDPIDAKDMQKATGPT